jgi:hypothetical protein
VYIVRQLRLIVLLALALALGLGVVNANAANSAATGCAGPPDSVFNQYCEPVPTATGGKSPGPGTPAVANTLPPVIVHSIAGAAPVTPAAFTHATTRKRLLTLPAPSPRLGVSGAAITNAWSLAWWLILLLAALAAGLAAAAIARRRRAAAEAAAAAQPPPPG